MPAYPYWVSRWIEENRRPRRQDLLYLQTRSTGLDSQVIGMMRVRDAQLEPGPADPKDWPYQNVLMAIADGWRVYSVPQCGNAMTKSASRSARRMSRAGAAS